MCQILDKRYSNTYYDRAKNKRVMSLLIKATVIRKLISSKQELIKNLDLAIEKLGRKEDIKVVLVK